MSDEAAAVPLALRLAFRLAMFGARFSRPVLLGVRGIVRDDHERVLLVRHSYVEGWHLPGGGVEIGETLGDALRRELAEEAGVILDEEPLLHGVFFNHKIANRDHVAVFVARRFHRIGPHRPNAEILECDFFPRDRLPAGTTSSTRQRLAEVFEGAPISPLW